MVTQEQVNELTSIIYEQLFSMSRDEFIAKAKEIAGDEWGFAQHEGDLDEQARDWLSNEALIALSEAETACAKNYRKAGHANMVMMRAITKYTMSGFKPVKQIWHV